MGDGISVTSGLGAIVRHIQPPWLVASALCFFRPIKDIGSGRSIPKFGGLAIARIVMPDLNIITVPEGWHP